MSKPKLAIALLVTTAALGCQDHTRPVPIDARTIENTPVAVMPSETLPTVNEDVAPVLPKNVSDQERDRIAALGERVELPFAPAIAMDPVDGNKVSIRTNTPMYDYQKHIYYFSSAANRQQFISNPDQYTKGTLAKYQ